MQDSKITLNGKAGVGTTTIGRALAEALGVTFTSGGTIMRSFCGRVGVSDADFKIMRLADPSWDERLDAEQKVLGTTTGSLVLESRLGWHFIPESLKVLVVCDEDCRIDRLLDRARQSGSTERREDVAKRECARAASDALLYQALYGIDDVFDPDQYDLVINSTVCDVAACVQIILEHAQQNA